jgi:hypothetical protein
MPSPSLESRLPGQRWFQRLRNPIVRVGVQVGVYLSIVMVAAVLLANRSPWLEGYANARNWAARIVFVLVAAIPILVFCRSAKRLFAAGILAWSLATLTYIVLGFIFEFLYVRLRTPGPFFMLGATVYGVAAIVSWVAEMMLAARDHHLKVLAAARAKPVAPKA